MTLTSRLGRWACAVVASLVATSTASAQGIGRADAGELRDALPAHVGTPRAAGRPAAVDLRKGLPPVGNQTMNDCAAWAFGYAARTFLEGIDQQWDVDRPERIFSPTFIYNQVNGGRDEGSNPLEVLRLFRERGAATLGTQPYLAKDFRTAPAAGAVAEARHFPIDGYSMARDGEAVRDALAAGNVVVVGVRTNPAFHALRGEVYDAARHADGVKRRRPNQPHGFHAMVVCGYSDERRAFLFMNSWGTGWGDRGFAWVSYDVADTFNKKGDDAERFMDFAVVMHDRREPVRRVGGGYEAVAFDKLTARHRFRCTGLDEAGAPVYDVTVELAGPAELLDRVERVRWDYTDGGQPRAFDAPTSRSDAHAAILTTRDRDLPLRGTIAVRGGDALKFDARLRLPAAMPHEPTLRRVDAYSHPSTRLDRAEPLFRWTLVPEMSETDWLALDRIEWSLTSGVEPAHVASLRPDLTPAPGANFTYAHRRLAGRPGEAKGVLAYPSGVSAAAPKGRATFRFRDGSTYPIDLPDATLPPAPGPNDDVRIETLTRPVGKYAGEAWHYFEVRALYPEAWHPYVTGGRFEAEGLTHDVFADAEAGRRSLGVRPAAYVFDGYARHAFNVTARFRLHRGAKPGPFEPPVEWVTPLSMIRGVHGRSTARSMATATVAPTSATPGLRATDEYLGLDAEGRPRWAFTPWFFDPRPGVINQVGEPDAWAFDREKVAARQVQDLRFGSFTTIVESAGPVELKVPVTVTTRDGDATRSVDENVVATLRPLEPASTGVALQVLDHLPRELARLDEPPSVPMVQVNLVGGRWAREQVRRVDYQLTLPGASVHAHRVEAEELADAPRLFSNVRLPAPPAGEPLRALVWFADGGAMLAEARPAGFVPYPDIPELTLAAVARFYDRDEVGPRWEGTLRIDGHDDVRDRIASVTFDARAEDGRQVEVRATDDPRVARVLTNVPLRVTARVTFKSGDREPRTLAATLVTPGEQVVDDAPRPASQLVRIEQAYMNRNAVNIWEGHRDPTYHHVVAPLAPGRVTDEIVAVEYVEVGSATADDPAVEAKRLRVARAAHEPYGPCAMPVAASYDRRRVTATLEMRDGTRITLPPIEVAAGDEEAGEDAAPRDRGDVAPRLVRIAYDGEGRDLLLLEGSRAGQWRAGFASAAYELAVNGQRVTLDSHAWPRGPAWAIARGEVAVRRMLERHWNDGELAGDETPGDRFVVSRVESPRAANALRVDVSGKTFRIVPDFDLARFEGVSGIEYELHDAAGGVRRVWPVAVTGLAPERFAATVVGDVPARIVAIARGGKAPATLAEWRRP